MKYLGAISDSKDIVNKGYVDTIPTVDVSGSNTVSGNLILSTGSLRKQDSALSYTGNQLQGILCIGTTVRHGGIQLYVGNGGSNKVSLSPYELTADRVIYLPDENGTLLTGLLGYTTSDNNRAVQKDSSGNLYVVQKDTNTYVTQTASTTSTWRKVLGTYNGNTSSASGSITSGTTNVTYYDADGPSFNTSTGQIYTKGYLMELSTSDALYTAINGLGWVSDVIE